MNWRENRVIRHLLDLGTLSALVNGVAALGCIWTMQSVTAEAGFATPTRAVMLLHRAAYGLLSLGLFANASDTLSSDTDPRAIDFMVQCLFLSVMAVSVARHRMSRPVVVIDEYGVVTRVIENPPRSVAGVRPGDVVSDKL